MSESALKIRLGDTLSYAGRVTLPAGTWTAETSFTHNSGHGAPACHHIQTSLSLVGPNTENPTLNDWNIALFATPAETTQWPKSSNDAGLKVSARIRFQDDSPTPIVKSSDAFTVHLLPGGC